MADHDVLSQHHHHHQQQQRYAPAPGCALQQHQHQQQSKVSSLEQAHELNEALVGKRKRGTVEGGGQGGGGAGAGGGADGGNGEQMLRDLKRRNGADVVVGGGGSSSGGGGELVGAQTRKRKSLEKLGASSSEQDVVSSLQERSSSKKLKAGGGGGGGGGEGSNGVDPSEASDEGTVTQGPALRLRFTRRGDAFAVTKKGPIDGMVVEGAHHGEEDDGGGDGEAQDGHPVGEGFKQRGISDLSPSTRNRMEGEVTGSDGPTDQGMARQSFAGGAADGTATSVLGKTPESRQPVTREIYRIPSHAGWFSWMKIHNIERRILSEFFDGKSISKTAKIYKDYRDFIINKYRENTQRTLTFTEVRRMLIGDVNAIRRVFDFLNHWGLINHQVVQEANDQVLGGRPPSVQTAVEPIPTGVRMALGSVVTPSAATARSSQPDTLTGISSSLSGLQSETLSSFKNVFTPLKNGAGLTANESGKSAPRYSCNSCGGDCTSLLFRCRKELQADYNLCTDCFKNGKYGPGMAARDFTRIEAETEALGDHWNTKETLSLLEAIICYGDNWSQVAEHVGSKSRSDCVERFIQLPFGDRFLSDAGAFQPDFKAEWNTAATSVGETDTLAEAVGNASVTSVAAEQVAMDGNGITTTPKSTGAADMEEPSPFEDATNPLLAQVAFMSAMVGPRVASAAAEAAISALAEEEPAVANLPLMNGHTVQFSVFKEGTTTGRQASESLEESSRSEMRHQGASSLPVWENDKDGVPSVAQVKASIATALGAAAVNAKLLADQEEREMEHCMSDIIENQLKRLYAKVEHFEELEMLVEKERIQLEQARQLIYANHIQFAESRFYLNRERHG